jgi:hypothetical protein
VRPFTKSGLARTKREGLQTRLRERLQKIWDAADPKPFPLVFDDFRQGVMEQFLDKLSKQDPDYRRHRI